MLFGNHRWPIETRSASIPLRGATRPSSCRAATCSISGSTAFSTSSVPTLSASRQSRRRSANGLASSVPGRSSMLDPVDQIGVRPLQTREIILLAFQFLARDRLVDLEEAVAFSQIERQRQGFVAAIWIDSCEIE